jgi:hypothetical protein
MVILRCAGGCLGLGEQSARCRVLGTINFYKWEAGGAPVDVGLVLGQISILLRY